jgi:hypothetical protein
MIVPWIGFPLNALIGVVHPTSNARYVAFESLYDPKQMPVGRYAGIPFPYTEDLRIDEAMHPVALLCAGLYGEGVLLACEIRRTFAYPLRRNPGCPFDPSLGSLRAAPKPGTDASGCG